MRVRLTRIEGGQAMRTRVIQGMLMRVECGIAAVVCGGCASLTSVVSPGRQLAIATEALDLPGGTRIANTSEITAMRALESGGYLIRTESGSLYTLEELKDE